MTSPYPPPDPNCSSVRDSLWRTLALVNEWLKFAEAKNGAATILAGGALGAIAQVWSNCHVLLQVGFGCAAVFLVLAIAVALISFLPALIGVLPETSLNHNEGNLVYYGDLAALSH